MRELVLRPLRALLWLVVAALLAFGSAGVVAGMDHDAGAARPELTWADDRAIEPGLDAAEASLVFISEDMDRLSAHGRGALAALVATDLDLLQTILDNGRSLLDRISAAAATVRRDLQRLPGVGRDAELRLGPHQRARYAALVDALAATEDLQAPWFRLANGGLVGARLASLLERHDQTAFAATGPGRRGEYEAAIEQITAAQALLEQATRLRDQLDNVVDVTTLDQWLERNRTYDGALRGLYVAFRDAGGIVTDAVRAAIAAEAEARTQLPPDTRGLVVIMAEIGRGGANQAVIELEEARGRLDAALDRTRGEGATPSP